MTYLLFKKYVFFLSECDILAKFNDANRKNNVAGLMGCNGLFSHRHEHLFNRKHIL